MGMAKAIREDMWGVVDRDPWHFRPSRLSKFESLKQTHAGYRKHGGCLNPEFRIYGNFSVRSGLETGLSGISVYFVRGSRPQRSKLVEYTPMSTKTIGVSYKIASFCSLKPPNF